MAFLTRRKRAELADFVRNHDMAAEERERRGVVLQPLVLVLDNVRSAYNVGSILRTAETAGVREALTVGAVTYALPALLLLKAAGATAIATGGLSLYALTTRRDFTMLGGMLYSCLLGLSALGLFSMLFPSNPLQTMRLSFGLVVFCGYLVYNTQMMMGGNKKRQARATPARPPLACAE